MLLTLANDFENLREKLVSLGYNGDHADDESLIQALVAVHLTLQTFELSEAARGAVLDLLSTTGRQAMHAAPDFKEDSWIDFDYGNVKLMSFVRVKRDAYDSNTGTKHNGLVGILTHMRGGVCTVDYIGLASGSNQRHPMEKLDSLKAVYNRRPSQNSQE
jgi:hypothetical protein